MAKTVETTIKENQVEKNMEMLLKLGLYRGLSGLGFPKKNVSGTNLRFPTIRTMLFGGLHWGPPVYGNYYITPCPIPIALP